MKTRRTSTTRRPQPRVRRTRFGGLPAIELRTAGLRLVATTGTGPRICHLGRGDGPNLLLWQPGRHRRGDWDLMGGHRVWIARPGADESEEAYRPDSAPCRITTEAAGFTLTAATDPVTRTTRSLRISALASGLIQVTHAVRNDSDMLWSGALWGLTCTVPTPSTTYLVPLSNGSGWDTASVVLFKRWGGSHTGDYDDPQFTFIADGVRVRALGRENKRMFRAEAGLMAVHDPSRDVLFVKRAAWERTGHYPMGCNLACYTGREPLMVEMESMGPFATLRPGETLGQTEQWFLGAAPSHPPAAARLAALFP